MITSSIRLCALPSIWWSENPDSFGSVATFEKDALGIERRIEKGVNLENEYARYVLCCNRIEALIPVSQFRYITNFDEFAATFKSGDIPFTNLSISYIDILAILKDLSPSEFRRCRAGAIFHIPSELSSHIEAFERILDRSSYKEHADIRRRLFFYNAALQHGCGVVELVDAVRESSEIIQPIYIPKKHKELDLWVAASELDDFVISTKQKNSLTRKLIEQINEGISITLLGKDYGKINLSNQPHSVITAAIWQAMYCEQVSPIPLDILYTDGSQSENPLLVHNLSFPQDKPSQTLPILRASLLSMRHLEMDGIVDFAWFRNRDVSKSRSLADTDAYCYQETLRLLTALRYSGGATIYIYQTGLQPAVIGFYRALAANLNSHRQELPIIQVIPQFFNRHLNNYQSGKAWY